MVSPMKTNYRQNSSKQARKWLIPGILLILVLAVGGYVVFKNDSNEPKPWETQSAENAENARKSEEAKQEQEQNGDTSTITNKGTVSISNFSEDANTVYVRAIVSGVTEGTCELELRKSGVPTIDKTASIEPVTTYVSCGFDIPKSEIKEIGVWTASVKVKDSSEPAAIATLNLNK